MTRSIGSGLLVGLLAVAGFGCSNAQDGSPIGGGGSEPGAGGAGAQGGAGAGGDHAGAGGGAPATCSSAPSATPLACEGASCTIAFDVEIRCTEPSFAAAGVRAAATPTDTFVATSTWDAARLFALDATGAVNEVDGFDLKASPIALDVSDDGRLLLAGDESRFVSADDYQGGLTALVGLPGALTRATVDRPGTRMAPFSDATVAPDGTPLVFFQSDGFSDPSTPGYTVATVAVDGSVTQSAAPFPDGTSYVRFGVATDGARLAFGVGSYPDGQHVRVREAGLDADLGVIAAGSLAVGDYLPLRAPLAAPSEAVRYAVLVQDAGGLRVVTPSAQSFAAFAVAGAASFAPSCAPGGYVDANGTCPPPCNEVGAGVEAYAYAAARAPGDRAVVAFVVTHRDDVFAYTKDCNSETGCTCDGSVKTDGTTHELVVASLSLVDGTAEELARTPMEASDMQDLFNLEGARLVDVGVRGDDVVVTARLSDAQGPKIRVVRATLAE
ncbi:MAG TPA: hypothetical protein VGM56_28565 [Byssovorax sp.]